MAIDVALSTREPQKILYIKRRVPPQDLGTAMAECLPAVAKYCTEKGFNIVGAPMARYVDMSDGHFTIEMGMPVEDGEGEGEIEVGELPGGDIAIAMHEGAYDTLGTAHQALSDFANQEKRAVGQAWESYLTDPGEVPDPAQWRTEVCLPLS